MSDEPGVASFRRAQRSSFAALAGAVALAAVAGWLWFDMRDVARQEALLEKHVNADLETLHRHDAGLSAQDQQFARQLGDLTSSHNAVSTRLDTLYGTRRSGLLAVEAEHLARLAAQRLALMQDPAGALALLGAADAALADIRDADTHAARAALAKDMGLLRDAAAVDTEAVYLRLAALADVVDTLAGQGAGGKPAQAAVPASAAAPARSAAAGSWWDRFTGTLMTLVTVRRVDTPLTPMATESERLLAAQNFRLLTEQAQLALLQRRGDIYRHSLEQADRWLARISSGDPAQRNAAHRELSGLRALGPSGVLPDLTGSISATRALAAKLLPEGGDKP